MLTRVSAFRAGFATLLFIVATVINLAGQDKLTVCEECLKKNVQYLASDELRGRGSATEDELKAAKYIANEFKKLGLQPLNPHLPTTADAKHMGYAERDDSADSYIVPVGLSRRKFTSPPHLKFAVDGKETVWTHGKEMLSPRLSQAEIAGKLIHAKADPAAAAGIPEGSIVIISDEIPDSQARRVLVPFLASKAEAVIIRATGPYLQNWDRFADRPASLPTRVEGESAGRARVSMIAVKADAISALAQAPNGTAITISGPTAADDQQTRNVVGMLPGSDPKLKAEYLVFSAHMDHLGICAKTGDTICNGADDDASGTATVLELARLLTSGPRPKRTVVFTTFGSEELGLLGSRGFAAKPPFPLSDLVADIEFEQTGLPEAKIGGKGFWMTGSQLSDLRSLLVQHGSELADDPFPGNPFFRASDNYSLAEKGVVAHTVSGAAEFPDYHKPGDEAQKLNYGFMAQSLQAVLPGLEWLANSDIRPVYEAGKNPVER